MELRTDQLGHMLYVQLGDEPSDDDEQIGMIINPARTAVLVQIANGRRPALKEHGEPSPGRRLLDLGLPEHPQGCDTVREYLVTLFREFFRGNADFKYGLGDSDWQYDLYGPMINAGLLPGRASYVNDGWGLTEAEQAILGRLIDAAIAELH